jgi:ribonuclease HII
MLWEARAEGNAAFASSVIGPREIDELNILEASLQAMASAAAKIATLPGGREPAGVLVDGNRLPGRLHLPARCLVKGDFRSFSIAAASIVAKVERDAIMDRLAERHPGYGWEKNRGYGTRDHLLALQRLGPSPEHRRSFRPVREALLEHVLSN